MRRRYIIRPLQYGLTTQYPSIDSPFQMAGWPTKNCLIDERSIQKRPGYDTADRNLGSGVNVQHVLIYQQKDGTRYTLYLTDTDLITKKTGAGETWQYLTSTYTTGLISGVSGVTITGDGDVNWDTGSPDLVAGDKFIIGADHSAAIEEDANWGILSSITNDTTLVLSGAYSGSATSGAYKIRRVYSTPSGERWWWAIVGDKFCFTNGNTAVQYWTDSNTYATDLETAKTVAVNARYCIEYANRLFIADYGSTRDPHGIAWSKEGDPTDWTDSTFGEASLLETKDIITGLGQAGSDLVVYKRDSIQIFTMTGVSTSPVQRAQLRRGIGCIAPNSIVTYMGTNAFLGRDNFYELNGGFPDPIGMDIRDKFFEIVGKTEAEKTVGFVDKDLRIVHWLVETNEGKYAFVWNYQTRQWTILKYYHDISCGGTGAL